MIAKWAYILIGDDRTGKTSFQKWLIWHLCRVSKFDRLHVNQVHNVQHRNAPRKLKTLFTINRSVQEKLRDTYKTIENYFAHHFRDADLCILSSHAHAPCINDIEQMIAALQGRYYNVGAVFFSNHLNEQTSQISQLPWQDRIVLDNSYDEVNWENQINVAAGHFSDMLIQKANNY